MNISLIIISLSGLFFLGHALNWFFIKTKIPDLLILIILGIFLGPMAFNLIDPEVHLGKTGSILGVVTLIVILYEGGLHLSFKDLVESSLSALCLSLLSFFSIAILTALVLLPVLPLSLSLLVGVGVGSTSSAIVIPMVKPLGINKQSKTILSLESAFTDVLTIVIFLALLEYISAVGADTGGGDIFLSLSSTPIASVAIGVLFGIIWSVLRKYTHVSTIPFAGESVALLTYGVLEFQSLNGALGVLSLGFTLANTNLLPGFIKKCVEDKPVSDNELSLLNAITFLLRTFFFVYLGLLIKISGLSSILTAVIITILIFITRYISIRLVLNKNQFSVTDVITATAMGPRGLACAVLATLPLQKGMAEGELIQNLIFAIIPFSILATSLFVSLTEKSWFKKKLKHLFTGYTDPADSTNNESPIINNTSNENTSPH